VACFCEEGCCFKCRQTDHIARVCPNVRVYSLAVQELQEEEEYDVEVEDSNDNKEGSQYPCVLLPTPTPVRGRSKIVSKANSKHKVSQPPAHSPAKVSVQKLLVVATPEEAEARSKQLIELNMCIGKTSKGAYRWGITGKFHEYQIHQRL
jgi:hypothetical protein